MWKLVSNQYDDIVLINVETDEMKLPDDSCATNCRIMTPALEKFQVYYENNEYFHADRMLKASVNLKRYAIKEKFRLQIIKTREYKNQILEIALKSFDVDRRFNVNKHCDRNVSEKIIKSWVYSIDEYYVCMYDDIVVGFIGVVESGDDIYEIKLAAVDEKYRMLGVAVEIYSYVCNECKNKGGKQLYGWISTVNMAVMNLYSSLGATFSNPSDIFLKQK